MFIQWKIFSIIYQMRISWTVWQKSKSLSNERGHMNMKCNDANKCKTHGEYNGGVWTGATAERINHHTGSTSPSSTLICSSVCVSVAVCGIKLSGPAMKCWVYLKIFSNFFCLLFTKCVTLSEKAKLEWNVRSSQKDFLYVLITYWYTPKQNSHKSVTNKTKKTIKAL